MLFEKAQHFLLEIRLYDWFSHARLFSHTPRSHPRCSRLGILDFDLKIHKKAGFGLQYFKVSSIKAFKLLALVFY